MPIKDYGKILENFLSLAVKKGASDLHLSPGRKPLLRIDSKLVALSEEKELNPEDIRALIEELLRQDSSKDRFEKFLKERELDFSYDFGKPGRFRGNAYFQQGKISCSLRFISTRILTIEELNLPPILHSFTKARQGFVLITGPSSHGKSTTLAALIDEINHTREEHIITIEDPIEYVFKDDLAIVDQREVYSDTLSFAPCPSLYFSSRPRCNYAW